MKLKAENLRQVPIVEFAKKIICDGHLFLVTKEGRNIYLMKPGVLVDPDFIEQHILKETILGLSPVTNEEVKQEFILILRELSALQFEKEFQAKAFEIIKLFENFYSRDEHFLNFSLACYEIFCDLPKQVLKKMHRTDMYMFRKALYSASFAVIIALSNDFYHPLLLKDLFNLTLTLDIGLCELNYSYYVSQACNQENKRPGTGKEWLKKNNATESEIDIFLKHPEKSYQFFKQNIDILTYPELAEIALYQHELTNGAGFPRGVAKGLISSWESVVILADSMVEIEDEYDFENRVLDYIFNFQNQKTKDLPVGRIFRKLCQSLSHFKSLKETAS
jgi:hypothetical protein